MAKKAANRRAPAKKAVTKKVPRHKRPGAAGFKQSSKPSADPSRPTFVPSPNRAAQEAAKISRIRNSKMGAKAKGKAEVARQRKIANRIKTQQRSRNKKRNV